MKIFKYVTLTALMAFNVPLLAMNALLKKQVAVATEQATKILKKPIRERAAKLGKGQGIKIFGSEQNPISLQVDKDSNPTTEALTNLLNTYQPLKEYIPNMPKVVVESSRERGNYTKAMYVAYRDQNKKEVGPAIKGERLFFLKITRFNSENIKEKLENLQKGPVGRFGQKALLNRDFPIIILQEMFFIYRGNENQNYTIEVMHLAHGQSAKSIVASGDLKAIKDCAEKIGKALGLFHIEFMNYHGHESMSYYDYWRSIIRNKIAELLYLRYHPYGYVSITLAQHWTTMVHGDFHLGNVFFDKKTSRVFFIDNAEMREDKLSQDLNALAHNLLSRMSNNDSFTNFARYFNNGYLSAYPLDKRKYIAAFLKEIYLDVQSLQQNAANIDQNLLQKINL